MNWGTWIAAALGLVAGSFLNVCAWRLPRGETVSGGRSRCPGCGRQLRAWENVPLVSYAWLRGRCRECRRGIGWRYPLLEAGGAAAFAWSWARTGGGVEFVREGLFLCLLMTLVVTDAETRQLPDELTLGGWVAALVLGAWTGIGWAAALVGGAVLAGGLGALAWIYERTRGQAGMGWGDVKMLGMLGAFLGLGSGLVALFAASVGAAGVGLVAAGVRGKSLKTSSLPFGIFLAAAGAAALAWGPSVWRAWLG